MSTESERVFAIANDAVARVLRLVGCEDAIFSPEVKLAILQAMAQHNALASENYSCDVVEYLVRTYPAVRHLKERNNNV
jgi:hypothetical protein